MSITFGVLNEWRVYDAHERATFLMIRKQLLRHLFGDDKYDGNAINNTNITFEIYERSPQVTLMSVFKDNTKVACYTCNEAGHVYEWTEVRK